MEKGKKSMIGVTSWRTLLLSKTKRHAPDIWQPKLFFLLLPRRKTRERQRERDTLRNAGSFFSLPTSNCSVCQSTHVTLTFFLFRFLLSVLVFPLPLRLTLLLLLLLLLASSSSTFSSCSFDSRDFDGSFILPAEERTRKERTCLSAIVTFYRLVESLCCIFLSFCLCSRVDVNLNIRPLKSVAWIKGQSSNYRSVHFLSLLLIQSYVILKLWRWPLSPLSCDRSIPTSPNINKGDDDLSSSSSFVSFSFFRWPMAYHPASQSDLSSTECYHQSVVSALSAKIMPMDEMKARIDISFPTSLSRNRDEANNKTEEEKTR